MKTVKSIFRQIVERSLICFYVITKKHYSFFGYNRNEPGNSGAVCIIEEGAQKNKAFLSAISDCITEISNKNEQR